MQWYKENNLVLSKKQTVLKMTYDGQAGVSSVGQTGQRKQRETIFAKKS